MTIVYSPRAGPSIGSLTASPFRPFTFVPISPSTLPSPPRGEKERMRRGSRLPGVSLKSCTGGALPSSAINFADLQHQPREGHQDDADGDPETPVPEPEVVHRLDTLLVRLAGDLHPLLRQLPDGSGIELMHGRPRLQQSVPGPAQLELGLAHLHAGMFGTVQDRRGALDGPAQLVEGDPHRPGLLVSRPGGIMAVHAHPLLLP